MTQRPGPLNETTPNPAEAMAVANQGSGRWRMSKAVGLALAAFLFVGFASLGAWQLWRLQGKLDLIERVQTRAYANPVALPEVEQWPEVNRAQWEYTRVQLTGKFAPEFTQLVLAVTENGRGRWVMTPVANTQGQWLWINRGFVPDGASPEQPPEGPVQIVGLLRLTEPKGGFLQDNQPYTGRWYSRDVEALSLKYGLDHAAPYFVDAHVLVDAQGREHTRTAPAGQPQPGLTVLVFKNNHLVYALTWFALALGVAGVTVWLLRGSQAAHR